MQLNYQDDGLGPTLIVMHGLFGSLANWKGIGRRLEQNHRVIRVDLRNHGRSQWNDDVSYPAMAGDIRELMEQLGVESATLVGHSMGGKVAMTFALTWPERTNGLLVVDIAPVDYGHSHESLIRTMLDVDLGKVRHRRDLDIQLEPAIPDPDLRSFLAQNLVFRQDHYQWRINLKALAAGMDLLTGFPDQGARHFDGPACFVHGLESDYVTHSGRDAIRAHFPNANLIGVPGAGHWVHAQQPEAIISALESLTAVT